MNRWGNAGRRIPIMTRQRILFKELTRLSAGVAARQGYAGSGVHWSR